MKHTEGEWTVSTTLNFDVWETAINRPENGEGMPVFGYKYKWLIVERYEGDVFIRGHEKWVTLMQEDPHRELEEGS